MTVRQHDSSMPAHDICHMWVMLYFRAISPHCYSELITSLMNLSPAGDAIVDQLLWPLTILSQWTGAL